MFLMDNKYIDHRNECSYKAATIDKVGGDEEKRGQQNRLVAVPASPIVAQHDSQTTVGERGGDEKRGHRNGLAAVVSELVEADGELSQGLFTTWKFRCNHYASIS